VVTEVIDDARERGAARVGDRAGNAQRERAGDVQAGAARGDARNDGAARDDGARGAECAPVGAGALPEMVRRAV